MAPIAIEYIVAPCVAVALYPDGGVLVSGSHCTKPTYQSSVANGTLQGWTLTRFGTRCDQGLVPDQATLDVAESVLAQHIGLLDPAAQYDATAPRETPWVCACVGNPVACTEG